MWRHDLVYWLWSVMSSAARHRYCAEELRGVIAILTSFAMTVLACGWTWSLRLCIRH